ncbi:MAG: WG repeat-containing protein [Clostridia bacterium]|nr:WG repeat-containing protein [Clostridia bacterium]
MKEIMVDLIGGNNQTEEQLQAKKWMKIIAIILVVLLLISIGLIVLVYYMQATELKITIDGVPKSNLKEILVFEENKVYVPIRDFATYVGYSSYSGDYKQYTEDMTKCYVQSTNEIASFTLNSSKIYKTDGNNHYEYYEIDEPVKMMDGKLYTTIEGASIAFNIAFSYNKNNITIYTLPYLVTTYTAKFKNAAIGDEKASFANQKAILYNMLVVKNEENRYGVNGLNGAEIIGTKYTSIEFIESTKEFIVTTEENKMGIMAHDATTKIKPEYDEIKQVDKDANLYLVTNNKKQGIVDGNGNIVLYLEYDQIGIDSTKFATNYIKNPYLLYDTCIPVKRANLWGLYDKNGKEIVPIQYDALGCSVGSINTNDRTANHILLIPDYEAIVVRKGELYGVFDLNGKQLLPAVLTSVYSVTSAGEDTYYMTYQGQVINVIDYLNKYMKKQETAKQQNSVQNTENKNVQTNTVTNSNNI